ncbi:MAG: hypothetical protein LQ352_006264 [Teloschistes flavicans]|nr:MAG: hypothetical protein LQ352_006264 [Teloschistes flavicans]
MVGILTDEKPCQIAIVGGGITGVVLAVGLLHRNVDFTIYERSPRVREVGAGIGFTPNAERAMQVLHPRMHGTFKEISTRNAEDWFQWVDGYNHDRSNPQDTNEDLIFKLYLGERGFEGCRRQDFLQGLLKLIPEEKIKYGKSIDSVTDQGDEEKVLLGFHDGTTAEADIGEKNPASYPSYTHKFAFRGLVPMDKARALLGDYKVSTRFMHLGPNAHALTFPVGMGTVMNVVAFATDPNDWHAKDGGFTAPATRNDAVEAFAAFGPAVRSIMSLLPEELDKWAIFDTYDHPAPSYVRGRLCLAGDAAHAAAPHHGAGAGYGVEDALVLATLMKAVSETTGWPRAEMVRAALETYNDVRYERTQWLVDSSRVVGELFEWQDQRCGSDTEKFGPEIERRSRQIWDYEVDNMVQDALVQFWQRVVS